MITSNWHQHSHNSVDCRGNGQTIAELIAYNAGLGMTDIGITDHIHTRFNLPDLVASSREFWSRARPLGVHLGVEVSVVSQWELEQIETGTVKALEYGIREGGLPYAPLALAIDRADLQALRMEYVVGGVHWPMYVPMEREPIIKDYFRQLMFLATHPLITIVAHPWWWMGHWQDADGVYRGDPWLDDFGKIPRSLHDEFAAAVRAHGKVVEINGGAMLENQNYPERFKQQYAEWLATFKAAGIPLAFGTDEHCADTTPEIMGKMEARLNSVGISNRHLWQLPPRAAGGSSDYAGSH